MPNKIKFLILIIALVLSCLPRPVSALFGIGDVGLFDVFENILSGIEEKVGPIFESVINVFTFYIIGVGFLALSSHFLESFISQQGQWMANIEPMTQAGWNFTAGLANMLLVLIFLVIAFAFILKIENFQAKKALPRLLIVALLINFSWVFVKMLTDVTQIVYNTILPENSLFLTVMEAFFGSALSLITNIVAWISAIGVALAIPIANSFTQVLISILTTIIILPNIIIWCIQAFFFYALSLMFLSFAFLFAARVFVIQILGILSPLAFLSLILPQTKSFWSQWYKTLMEWLLLGIFFLFFLVLGFGVVGLLAPTGMEAVMLPGFSMFNFGGQIAYHFAIFVYMAVILLIGKKFVPQGAQELINFAKGVAGAVVTKGLVPLGRATGKNLTNFAIAQKQREDRLASVQERAEAGGHRIGLSRMDKFAMGAGGWMRRRVEQGYRVAGTSLAEESSKEIKKAEAEAAKISDPNLLLSKIKHAERGGGINRELGLIAGGINKGGPWKKLLQAEGNIDKSKIVSLGAQANATGAKGDAEALAQGFIHKLGDNDLSRMGFKIETKDKEKYSSLSEMIWGKAKTKDLGRFAEGSWLKDGKIIEPILKHFEGRRIAKMYEENGPAFAEDYMTGAEEKGSEWFIDNNASAALWLTGNGAQDMGFRALKRKSDGKELNKNELRQSIGKMRENVKKEKELRKEEEATTNYEIYKTGVYRERREEETRKESAGQKMAAREEDLTRMMERGVEGEEAKKRQFEREKTQKEDDLRMMMEKGAREEDLGPKTTGAERVEGKRAAAETPSPKGTIGERIRREAQRFAGRTSDAEKRMAEEQQKKAEAMPKTTDLRERRREEELRGGYNQQRERRTEETRAMEEEAKKVVSEKKEQVETERAKREDDLRKMAERGATEPSAGPSTTHEKDMGEIKTYGERYQQLRDLGFNRTAEQQLELNSFSSRIKEKLNTMEKQGVSPGPLEMEEILGEKLSTFFSKEDSTGIRLRLDEVRNQESILRSQEKYLKGKGERGQSLKDIQKQIRETSSARENLEKEFDKINRGEQ